MFIVSICNVELSQHYASIKKVLSKYELLQTDRNMQTYAILLHILLQTCQGNIYYFERHITVNFLTNPFSVLFSIQFSSPVRLLVNPMPGVVLRLQDSLSLGTAPDLLDIKMVWVICFWTI